MKLLTDGYPRNTARERKSPRGHEQTIDFKPAVKLLFPLGAATWLFAGLDPEDPDIAFGLCDLGSVGMVHVEHVPSRANERGTANAYRLPFINAYIHLGTRGRDPDFALAE